MGQNLAQKLAAQVAEIRAQGPIYGASKDRPITRDGPTNMLPPLDQTTAFGSGQTTGFGSGQTTGFGSGQTTGFGSGQTTAFGSGQTTAFGSGQTSAFGGASATMTSTGLGSAGGASQTFNNASTGANKNPMGLGAGQASLGLGANQNSTGVGAGQASLGLGANQNSTGVGSGQASLGLGANQNPMGLGAGQASTFGGPSATMTGTGLSSVGGSNTASNSNSTLFGSVATTSNQGLLGSSTGIGQTSAFGSLGATAPSTAGNTNTFGTGTNTFGAGTNTYGSATHLGASNVSMQSLNFAAHSMFNQQQLLPNNVTQSTVAAHPHRYDIKDLKRAYLTDSARQLKTDDEKEMLESDKSARKDISNRYLESLLDEWSGYHRKQQASWRGIQQAVATEADIFNNEQIYVDHHNKRSAAAKWSVNTCLGAIREATRHTESLAKRLDRVENEIADLTAKEPNYNHCGPLPPPSKKLQKTDSTGSENINVQITDITAKVLKSMVEVSTVNNNIEELLPLKYGGIHRSTAAIIMRAKETRARVCARNARTTANENHF